jgi:hypothetical protein
MQRVFVALTLLLVLIVSGIYIQDYTTESPGSTATSTPVATPSLESQQHRAYPLVTAIQMALLFHDGHGAPTARTTLIYALQAAKRGDTPPESATQRSYPAAPISTAPADEQPPVQMAPVEQLPQLEAVPFARFELPTRYFEQTGHNVWGPFLAFYEAQGGVALLGLPLTEVLNEDGQQVQYFERARLVRDPQQPDTITRTPLGSVLAEHAAAHANASAFAQHEPQPAAISRYSRTTGHNIGHWFADFWQAHGGAARLGHPISEAFFELRQHGEQATLYRMQYFEYARLEAPLDQRGYAHEVHLALLGREYLTRHRAPTSLLDPALPIRRLGESTLYVGSSATGSVKNVHLATHNLHGLWVEPGKVGSFLDGIGAVTAQAGYTSGAAIVGGSVVEELGGGICYVSTILYRAILDAGLEVVERSPHTLALSEFSSMPGLDSAVFTPDMDMRWRNDTPGPLFIASEIAADGAVVIRVWGYDDGRTTKISEPLVSYVYGSGEPIWRYDEDLPEGTVKQIAHGGPGMNVTVERMVYTPDNAVLHYDQIVSSYAPWHDVFVYGPGVEPECEQDENEQLAECEEYHRQKRCEAAEDAAACEDAEQEEERTDAEQEEERIDAEQQEENEQKTTMPTPTATPVPPQVVTATPLPTATPAPSQNEGAPPVEVAPPPATPTTAPPVEVAPPPATPTTAPPVEVAEPPEAPAPPPEDDVAPVEVAPAPEQAPPAPTEEPAPVQNEGAPAEEPAPVQNEGAPAPDTNGDADAPGGVAPAHDDIPTPADTLGVP